MGRGLLLAAADCCRLRRRCVDPVPSLPGAVMLVIAIFLYDGVFKATFAGPILMGLLQFANILPGPVEFSAWAPPWGWLVALVIGIYIAASRQFACPATRRANWQPADADRNGGRHARQLAFGNFDGAGGGPRRRRAEFHPSRFFFSPPAAVRGCLVASPVLRAIRRPDPLRVRPVVKLAVLGLVILDALLVTRSSAAWAASPVILLVPGIILGRWLYSDLLAARSAADSATCLQPGLRKICRLHRAPRGHHLRGRTRHQATPRLGPIRCPRVALLSPLAGYGLSRSRWCRA